MRRFSKYLFSGIFNVICVLVVDAVYPVGTGHVWLAWGYVVVAVKENAGER